MTRNDFPVSGRDDENASLFTGVHRPVMPANPVNGVRAPWRPVGAAAASLGAPVGIGILHPMLGEVIAVMEVVVLLTIIATALFGSRVLSERAFRLLRWLGNRPEPPAPSGKQGEGIGDTTSPRR